MSGAIETPDTTARQGTTDDEKMSKKTPSKSVVVSLFLGGREVEYKIVSIKEARSFLETKTVNGFRWLLSYKYYLTEDGIDEEQRDVDLASIFS